MGLQFGATIVGIGVLLMLLAGGQEGLLRWDYWQEVLKLAAFFGIGAALFGFVFPPQ